MTDGFTAAPAHQSSAVTDLSFDSTVPRHFVHRAAVAEVLLTDWKHRGPDTFVCAGQWPRGHALQSTRDNAFDPLLVAETIRQSGILLAHVGYAVPLDHAFLMQRLRFTCAPEGMRSSGNPLDIVVEVSVRDIRGARRLSGMRIDAVLWSGGAAIAEGSGWLRCVAPTAYDRLRQASVPGGPGVPLAVTPLPQAQVGRLGTRDVVIGPGSDARGHPLRVPIEHPVFFDHALDHVPGMLVIEALRQAGVVAIAAPGAALISADVQFADFLELDREYAVRPRVLGEHDGRRDVLVVVEHERRRVVHGTLSLLP
jgi:hypothetical protein